MSKQCPSCGQRIQETRKESLSKMKLKMLRAAADHVIATGRNDFMVRDISDPDEYKLYSNFHHLRFHGVIAKVKKDGHIVPRHWLVTRNGWRFLRGEIQLPKYVMVRLNGIESRADTMVSLGDVWYGTDYIQTNFEYFDHETGERIGWRPRATQSSPQAALF
jgi:hypothetical protein